MSSFGSDIKGHDNRRHPVLREHPITGRKVVFVNEGFTAYIEGLPDDESATILARLYEHIVRPEALAALHAFATAKAPYLARIA